MPRLIRAVAAALSSRFRFALCSSFVSCTCIRHFATQRRIYNMEMNSLH